MGRPTPLRDFLIAAVFGSLIGAALLVDPLVAVALIVVTVAGYIFLTHPMWALYVFIITIPMTSGMPRGRLLPMLIPNEAILVATLGVAFLAFTVLLRRRQLPGWVLLACAILLIGTMITPLLGYYARRWPLGVGDIMDFAAPAQYLLIGWIFANIPSGRPQRERIVQLMFLMGSIVSVIGLLQAQNVGFIITFLQTYYPSGHLDNATAVGRITSVLGAWNVLGTFCMTNLLLLTAFQGQEQPNKLYLWNARISGVLTLFTLIATGSFASIIMTVIGFFIVKLFSPKGFEVVVPMIMLSIIAGIVLSPLLSERLAFQFQANEGSWVPRTLADRFDIWWGIYLPLIARDPMWGVSPNTEGLVWGYAESQYINLLYKSGLVSLMAHLSWVGLMMLWLRQRVIRHRAKFKEARIYAIVALVLIFNLSIMGLTNAVFTYSGTVDYLWVLLGLTINAREDEVYEPA